MDRLFWSVAQVRPGASSMAVGDLRQKGFDVFAPVVLTRKLVHVGRKTRAVEMRAPLFCGYVFVGWPENVDGWGAACGARGVVDLLRKDGKFSAPARVLRPVMASLLARGEVIDLTKQPKELAFKVGDSVELVVGVFQGRRGKLVWLDEKRRIGCLLELQPTAAERLGFRMRASVGDLQRVAA